MYVNIKNIQWRRKGRVRYRWRWKSVFKMRNLLFILSLIFIFNLSSFAQASQIQPVKITNFGTATRDEVRGLRKDFKRFEIDVAQNSYESYEQRKRVESQLSSLNDMIAKTNDLLTESNDNHWSWWDVFFTGLLFVVILSLIAWALIDSYLGQYLRRAYDLPLPPTTTGNPTSMLVLPSDEYGEGDYLSERAIVVKNNEGAVTITVSNNYHDRGGDTHFNIQESEIEEWSKILVY